jgi:hypothetical protein
MAKNCSDFILILSEMIQQAATCAGMMGNSEQAREATKIYDKGM